MIIKLQELAITTRKEPVSISFDNLNYFYGQISSGKSTIARLIMYCLGKSLELTPALQTEFVSVQLKLIIGKYDVILEREKNSNQIIAHYNDKQVNESKSLVVPISAKDEVIIPDEEVYNISDFIFYLGGVEPPKVLRSKTKEDSKRIRLSIRDLMWYCYLAQEDMDSSFFYLAKGEDFSRQLKSRDSMRYVLGYYQDEVSKLEEKIVQIREEKSSAKTSAEQIREILEENKIDSTEKIIEDKKNYEKELSEIENKISKIKTQFQRENEDVINKLIEERKSIHKSISEIQDTLSYIDNQIEKQTKLKHEFLTANIRSKRDFSASKLFKELSWSKCPECGNEVKPKHDEHTCPLCQKERPETNSYSSSLELVERSRELDNSISSLKNEKRKLEYRLEAKETQVNELNKKVNYLDENYDSQFLTTATSILNQKGVVEGKIMLLEKLLPLPQKADELEQHSFDLESELAKLQDKYKKAKKEAEKDKENIDLLKKYFLENLIIANFPQIGKNYEVIMNTNDFIPRLKPSGEGDISIVEFSNLGSGGKQTLFKTCFALALHRVSMKSNKLLPSFLIIDSPMKNIETKQDEEIFEGFHKLIYSLATKELKNLQIIVIGSEYKEPDTSLSLKPNTRELTRDVDSESPPLIPYYKGQ